MSLAVSSSDVEAAAGAIRSGISPTPSAVSKTLSEITGAHLVIKFENLQFTASYKERGALNKLMSLDAAARRRGVLAVSAGNHAQAVAYHARRLGVDATIVMPERTPFVKVARTASLGAKVILQGGSYEEAWIFGSELAGSQELTMVRPFDDPLVIAGQGTVGLELLSAHSDLDALIVPVGGGGLIAGIAAWARRRFPSIEIVGVQTELYPSMANAFHGRSEPCGGVTIAEGIAVAVPGSLTAPMVQALADDVVTVSEGSIEEAICLYLEIEKVVTEGAGAAGLAAVVDHRERFAGRRVGLILTGANIDPRLLASVIMRGLVRSGRVAHLRVRVSDAPGSLGHVTALIGELGGNILEVAHRRHLATIPALAAELEIAVEARDRAHSAAIIDGLVSAGLDVAVLDPGPGLGSPLWRTPIDQSPPERRLSSPSL